MHQNCVGAKVYDLFEKSAFKHCQVRLFHNVKGNDDDVVDVVDDDDDDKADYDDYFKRENESKKMTTRGSTWNKKRLLKLECELNKN